VGDLETKIRKKMVSAISDYHMLEDGDRLLVAVSGGKDSTIMLLMLYEILRRAKIDFSISAVMLDQKQPGFAPDVYRRWLKDREIEFTILEQDTHSIVIKKTKPGKSYCRICARLRRGSLYSYAHTNRYTKIALGHHRDDLNETLLLNMFFTGTIAGMPPKLISEDSRNVVIRPLCYVSEQSLISYAKQLDIPTLPCNLCESQENTRRSQMKELLQTLENKYPDIGGNILKSQTNIRPSQLMDKNLWDFATNPAKN
jgi:tRNA 2-thiocytidine biosynthesis protein TtcA